MPCRKPLEGYKDITTGGLTFDKKKSAGEKMKVACGNCLQCRLDRSRTWAMRIVHEASLWDENCFITLTYREECNATEEQRDQGLFVPRDGSLNKKHFQDFMKRLRKRYPQVIRYYHCGEYGDKLQRPHYHACLFNLQFDDLEQIGISNGIPIYTSKTLEDVWRYGFVTVGELNMETAAYTARYCLKKINGRKAQDHYLRCDEYGVAYWLEQEYTTMSRGRPCKDHKKLDPECPDCQGGIGSKWYAKFKDDVHPSNKVPVPGSGVFNKVPRYYEKLLERENPVMHSVLAEERRDWIRENPEEFTPERLESKYKVKKAQVSMLKRGLENDY
jgi:hypothetical protein